MKYMFAYALLCFAVTMLLFGMMLDIASGRHEIVMTKARTELQPHIADILRVCDGGRVDGGGYCSP